MSLIFLASVTDIAMDVLNQFITVIPKFVKFLVIIIIGFIVAKIVYSVVKKGLSAVGVDKLGDKLNEIDVVQKANVDVKISALFAKILYYFIFFFFLMIGTEVLEIQSVSNLMADLFNFIPKLIVALIIIIVGLVVADAIRGVIKTACDSMNIPSGNMISMMIFYFLLINIFISALSQANINTDFFSQNISLIIGGIIFAFAIGYGLASKDIVANFLASFYSAEKFKIGEKISVNGKSGKIVEIDRSNVTIENDDRLTVYPMSYFSKNEYDIIK